MTLIDDELGALAYHSASRSWGFRDGVWREAIVFVVDGEEYCLGVTPEAERADCDFVPELEQIPWSAQEFVGVAIVAYTNPDEPWIEHLRILEGGCQVWQYGSCAELPGTTYTRNDHWSSMTAIQITGLSISDVDGDKKPELVLVMTYVKLASVDEGDLGDLPDSYSVKIFNRRRLTVLRDDLTLQLDLDIGQEMYELAPGTVADNDVVTDYYLFEADAATVSWCELDMHLGLAARECLEQVCASPTTRARFAYDPAKDLYTNATIEALRPIVNDWDGCPEFPPAKVK